MQNEILKKEYFHLNNTHFKECTTYDKNLQVKIPTLDDKSSLTIRLINLLMDGRMKKVLVLVTSL